MSSMHDQIERARQGDKAAREDIITENMPLVIYKARKLLNSQPNFAYFYDDLIGEGNYAICRAVDKLINGPQMEDSNYLGYISVAIYRAFSWVLKKESCAIRTLSLNNLSIQDLHQGQESIETWELIESICINERDKEIVLRRLSGHNDAQIAEELDISRAYVHQIRVELKERLHAQLN